MPMASSLPVGTRVDRGFVESLAQQVAADRPLPWLRLQCGALDSPDSSVVACYVFYVRGGGFMLCFSADSAAAAILGELATARELLVAYHPCEVEVATSRGRGLGRAKAMLTDMPWDMVDVFQRGSGSRGAGTVVQFSVGGQSCRPVAQSVMTTADGWISGSEMDAAAAQDYVTGEEFSDEAEASQHEGVPATTPVAGAQDEDLRRRISELEAQLRTATQASAPAAPRVPILGGGKAPPAARQQTLFAPPEREGALDSAAWKRLQNLAGPPPGRGASSKAPAVRPETAQQDSVFAEIEKEVEDPQDGSLALLPDLMAESGDPLQKLLVAQMQQNALLLQKVLGNRQSDPILGVLAGSSSSRGGFRSQGLLGSRSFPEDHPEHRQSGGGCSLQCHGGAGHDARSTGRFCDASVRGAQSSASRTQVASPCALDSGKLPLAWLMTGYSEPNMQVLISHKHRPGLKPFSRLASPSWVSANLAYLRDLDFLEGRMNQIGKQKPPKEPADGDDDIPKRPKKPKAKGQPKSGDGGAPST